MLLVGRIMKREETPQDPLGDATYLIGVSATNLAKDVGDTVDLVPVEHLQRLKCPEWALARLRNRFPEVGLTSEALRKQLDFWHKKILPLVLKGRR